MPEERKAEMMKMYEEMVNSGTHKNANNEGQNGSSKAINHQKENANN